MNESQGTISFILDDKIVTLDFIRQKISPTLTVLNYLRSLSTHNGVKEGCAEGDCGACTVVLAELDEKNNLVYKAVNSCLVFLPMIHGKQLITVENLATKNAQDIILHPVQQALVDYNGSQCGYCTPGIVMSMFALYKNYKNPSREIIEDALTGNLCRCTGYQPILNAAMEACRNHGKDQFFKKEKETISLLKSINSNAKPLSVVTSNQRYFQPKNLNECFDLLNKYPKAICINGSTDIALKQTKKFEVIEELIDLSTIKELKFFDKNKTEIIIGSGLSLEDIKSKLDGSLPALTDMLNVFASKQIRNLATLGGNIATASPIGDSIPLLFANDAKVRVISKKNERNIPIESFIKGYRKTNLQKGEIIHSIIIPKVHGKLIRFYKVSKRKDLDISTVSAGFRLELKNGFIKDICLAFGGMAEMTKRAVVTENYLVQKKWTFENILNAQKILEGEFKPISDARSGVEFRFNAAKNLLLKFFEETRDDATSVR